MDIYVIEIFTALLSGIFGPLIILYIQRKLENKKRNAMVESLKLSGEIQEKIEGLRESINADRVWINQFHNGGNFYPTGKSIQKFSATYESCSSNAYSTQSQFQNIPITLFAKMFKSLVETGKAIVPDFSDPNYPKLGLDGTAEQTQTKSTYVFAISTFDDKFVGCLGIDYCQSAVILSDEEINKLMLEATSLGGVLKNYLKNA
jgi:hypothetical protein